MTQLEKDFEEFDNDNPGVWTLFVQFTNQLIAAGRRRLSASLIIERIRWESYITTMERHGYKINNNFTAYYARKFNQTFPDCGAKFALRATHGQEILTYDQAKT